MRLRRSASRGYMQAVRQMAFIIVSKIIKSSWKSDAKVALIEWYNLVAYTARTYLHLIQKEPPLRSINGFLNHHPIMKHTTLFCYHLGKSC